MKAIVFTIIAFSMFAQNVLAQNNNNWRGPERDGHYPQSNLLKSWPQNGPRMIWAMEDLGKGFTSPVLSNGKIYVTGMEGDMGYVYILNEKGQLERKYPYGKEIAASYPGTRSTPTIIDNLMYVATGEGELICLDLNNGQKKWSKGLFSDFDGSNLRWGFTENLVIDEDILYATPGGRKYNVVALNRHTGNMVWSSQGKGGLSAYCSPLLINHRGKKMLVTLMQNDVIGLDPKTGKLLWSHPYSNNRSIHPNTPIYHNGDLYVFSGYGKGGYMLRINADGNSVSKVWENDRLDPKTGGAVLVDGYLYGGGDRNRRWFGVNWRTGEVVQEVRDIDTGTVIAADGLLYAYTERGELALLEPRAGNLRVVSQTRVELGSDQHWAHLVISNGILYVRHGNALMAYDIRG
jgi:outer membrane protein assembly factor BamB